MLTLKVLCSRFDWEQTRYFIMPEAVLTKFFAHFDIKAILLNTGDKLLLENSLPDYYSGCGLARNAQNHAGKI